jgi:hypothetical protein
MPGRDSPPAALIPLPEEPVQPRNLNLRSFPRKLESSRRFNQARPLKRSRVRPLPWLDSRFRGSERSVCLIPLPEEPVQPRDLADEIVEAPVGSGELT